MSEREHATYIENVDGGYRVWCEPCGVEEKISIAVTGMPIRVFEAWCKDFMRRHPKRRRAKGAEK